MRNQKHISIRIDEKTLQKLHYIAKYDDRSVSRKIICLINNCIRNFEKEHGEIEEKDFVFT